jgi:myo-inositol-1(or 4)-monophosphatase
MFDEYIELARKAARQAGAFLLQDASLVVDSMEGKDIKLAADKESEKIILDALAPSGLPVLTEESGIVAAAGASKDTQDIQTGLHWIVDPLDGSMNFYKGLSELCCASIALWDKKQPVFGIVYRFANDECFEGMVGKGATLNGKPIAPSTETRVCQAALATGLPLKGGYSTASLETLAQTMQAFKKVRMLGTAALMATFVACGRVDVYQEDGIMLWDIAAATALILAVGGIVALTVGEDYRCRISCFASKSLQEDYLAKGL